MPTTHENRPGSGLSVLLTGGSGFLGKAIAAELLDPGCPLPVARLRIFDVVPYRGISDPRVEFIQGDVRDRAHVEEACRGIDAVIHSAAIVDWGTRPESEIFAVNTDGTRLMVEACRKMGIRYMVYTSSLDAIYTGRTMRGIDETIPYPAKHATSYCASKAEAEKVVLQAAAEGLSACVLRPSDIWGPADPFHIGSLINMAKGGFYVRLGDGTALSQHVYVGNMAWAHILALKALLDGNPAVAGQAYLISDAPPSNFFRFFDAIVEGAGYRIWPRNFWIPRGIAYAMGASAEFFALLLRPVKKTQPKFSRFAVRYTCNDFTFNTVKARRDFGFEPKYPHTVAFEETVKFYRNR